MAYFGSFPPEPYGIVPESVRSSELTGVPAPGLYAISAKYVSRSNQSWLSTIPPSAFVGHALYIYDIPPQQQK
jgi:hypothetical protein